MFEVAVRRSFTAFHHLIGGDWGAENQHHSHDYIAEIVCEGRTLDRHQYLFDISVLERHLDTLVEHYRGKSLNALPGFEGLNPSIELFAKILGEALRQPLSTQPTLTGFKVVLWEHAQAWASYRVSLK